MFIRHACTVIACGLELVVLVRCAPSGTLDKAKIFNDEDILLKRDRGNCKVVKLHDK